MQINKFSLVLLCQMPFRNVWVNDLYDLAKQIVFCYTLFRFASMTGCSAGLCPEKKPWSSLHKPWFCYSLLLAGISTPIPVLGLRDPSKVFRDGSCLLTDVNFVLIGSLVAFFLPLTIMVVTYFMTISALQNEASRFCLDQLVPRPRWSSPYTQTGVLPQVSPSSQSLLLCGCAAVSGCVIGRRTLQSISNEQKASKVLGVVFLLFIVMWCPFFITNVLAVVCGPAVCPPGLIGVLLNVFVWVGYLSSAVNPLVYTLFNRTYRSAFLRYIHCHYRPQRNNLQLILVNTIPPMVYNATRLPMDHGAIEEQSHKLGLMDKGCKDKDESLV